MNEFVSPPTTMKFASQNNHSEVTQTVSLALSNTSSKRNTDYISYEVYTILQIATNCGLNPVLFIFGFTLNSLSAAVFWSQGLRDRMNFCLFCLAIVDTLYLAAVLVVGSHCMVSPWSQTLASVASVYGRFFIAVITEALMHSSAVITAIISVERCVCVAQPLRAATLMKTRTMVLLLAGSLLLVHLLCYAVYLKRQMRVVFNPATGLAEPRFLFSDLYLKFPQVFDGIYFFVSIVLRMITFVVISGATVITVFMLRRAITWRRDVTSSDKHHDDSSTTRSQLALVKMLVVISGIYIACAVPSLVVSSLRSMLEGFEVWGPYPLTVVTCLMMAQLTTKLNSAVNFLVYISQSSRFRRVLVQILPCVEKLYPAAWRKTDAVAAVTVTAHTTTTED